MWDSELELVYYNYRYLCPNQGKFIERDIINELDSWNLYSHLSNSSIHYIDILGLLKTDPCIKEIVFSYDYIMANTEEVIAFDKAVKSQWEESNYGGFNDPALKKSKVKRPYQLTHIDKEWDHKQDFSSSRFYSGKVYGGRIIIKDYRGNICDSIKMQVGGRASQFKGTPLNDTAVTVNGYIETEMNGGATINGFRVTGNKNGSWLINDNGVERVGILIHPSPIALPAHANSIGKGNIYQLGSHGCFSVPDAKNWEKLRTRIERHKNNCKSGDKNYIDYRIEFNISTDTPDPSKRTQETNELINRGLK